MALTVTRDLRERLAIPSDRLADLNAFLLQPGNAVIDDLLAVVARYGTPDEINARAREAGTVASLREHVRRDEDVLKRTKAGRQILDAVTSAPLSPDDRLAKHRPAHQG